MKLDAIKRCARIFIASGALFAVVGVSAYGQLAKDVPHRIIYGLRYDWPTAVICLKETDATKYIRVIRPRLSTYARFTAVPGSNVLIATVPPERLPVLLATIAALDRYGTKPSDAIKMLPNMYEDSRNQPEPEQPPASAEQAEEEFRPQHLPWNQFVPHLQMYGDTPIMPTRERDALIIYGDSAKVAAQMELAYSMDVADYEHCKEVNGN